MKLSRKSRASGKRPALRKLQAENLRLRDAVTHRTVELDRTNYELKIEAALERVRATAMAMKQPADMLNICKTISQQLVKLRVKEIRNVQTAIIYEQKGTYTNYEFYTKHNKLLTTGVSYTDHPMSKAFVKQMLSGPNSFFKKRLKGKKVQDWYAFQKTTNQFADKYLETATSLNYYWYSLGPVALGISTYYPLSEEEENLCIRFRNVFELSYKRYLDIEKAEAQAREAQIEVALERVRARTMAMQHSDELSEAVEVLFKQFELLGENPEQLSIGIVNEPEEVLELWASLTKQRSLPMIKVSMHAHDVMREYFRAWKERRKILTLDLTGNKLKEYQRVRKTLDTRGVVQSERENRRVINTAFFSKGGISLATPDPRPDETIQLLERFASVFDQTYTRFLDLQKAEMQAREANIEASLERVRSKAMAMHESRDLSEAATTVFTELKKLGITPIRSGVGIISKETRRLQAYSATSSSSGDSLSLLGSLTMIGHPEFERQYEYWLRKENYFVALNGEELKSYYGVVSAALNVPIKANEKYDRIEYGHWLMFSEGFLFAWSDKKYSDEELTILERFKNIVELTFRRFFDLQKAEAQAREAQIEAALERVRSRAMAMQQSDDLASAVAIIFEELDKLNLGMLRCGIGILHKETRTGDVWTTSLSDQGKTLQVAGDESMDIHPLLQGAFDGWLKQEDFSYVLEGKDLNNYYRALTKVNFHLPEAQSLAEQKGLRQYYYCAVWQSGGLFAFRETPFPDEAKTVMKRFADVFTLTYTRFLDLQKAEANAREAKIETGVERVRSRTLAMQSSNELAETAAVVVQQLVNLGIPPSRLYIAIIHDDTRSIEFWITDEDGGKVSQQFIADISRNETLKNMYDGWKAQEKSIIIDMEGVEVENYLHYLNNELHVSFKGGLSQKRRVQSIAYFGKGFMGIGSPEPQSEETISLLERFASAFNLTYTRFNDLKIAEAHAIQAERDLIELKAAKQRAEDALTELKATQEQLVQQEKLASLGQLTAGIAHEIKNPLNFVNNFSDVSIELLDEAREEIKALNDGNQEKNLLAIIDDVSQNLKKIHEHGTRADGIVKSMLHHSRGSNGKMEPTDLSALIKEYVNLAFHGMRAGKNPINVDIQLTLDESVGSIPLITEDFSRVILNLSQNAFDAMREKLGTVKFSPVLMVRTKRIDKKVQIEVEDNGPGIPDEIKDKVLQPFFTTKKGTQGTGLGLSITNDIVKAHRGELRVDSIGNNGAIFRITLLT